MRFAAILLILAGFAAAQQEDRLAAVLNRVSEEAEVFAREAPKILGQEVLHQRTLGRRRGFRLRIGAAPTDPPPLEYISRELISEYGYSAFQESPEYLHEFRTVISVDGKEVVNREKARETLTMGITSNDDRLRKQLLKEFERHGLKGAAADFGQYIMTFSRRQLNNYDFEFLREDHIGAEAMLVFAYKQKGGTNTLTVFEGREAVRLPLNGELWVRESDYVPLRVTLHSERESKGRKLRDEAVVDYEMSGYGVLLPVSVVHRNLQGDILVVENRFQYTHFRKFGAQAEITFDEAEEPEEPKQPEAPKQ